MKEKPQTYRYTLDIIPATKYQERLMIENIEILMDVIKYRYSGDTRSMFAHKDNKIEWDKREFRFMNLK